MQVHEVTDNLQVITLISKLKISKNNNYVCIIMYALKCTVICEPRNYFNSDTKFYLGRMLIYISIINYLCNILFLKPLLNIKIQFEKKIV